MARTSGPLLDRIDLHVQVPAVRWEELSDLGGGVASEVVRRRVGEARRLQERASSRAGNAVNAALPDADLETAARISTDAHALLGRAAETLALSARGIRRTLRVARTIADMAGARDVEPAHVAEAVGYRDLRPMLEVTTSLN